MEDVLNQVKALEELQELMGTERIVVEVEDDSEYVEDDSEYSEPFCIGEYYLSGILASVHHAINRMKQVYCPLTDSYDELESVMEPRDWAIFCMLNRLECDLHI